MILKIVSTLALIAMATTAVSAQEGASANPLPKPPSEKKICRGDAETGSILARRRCFTRTQWAEIERKSGEHNAKDVDKFGDSIRTLHGLGPNR